jgi:hypothetical protein
MLKADEPAYPGLPPKESFLVSVLSGREEHSLQQSNLIPLERSTINGQQ